MGSRGPTGARTRAAAALPASGTFHVTTRERAVAVDAVKRLASQSAGRPLDEGTRAEMEATFAHDFARVLVHTDDAAAELAEAIGAEALTVGDHIYFAEGRYRPGDDEGNALLAHELAHVAQAGAEAPGAPEGGDREVSDEDGALEQHAEALARQALRSGVEGDDTAGDAIATQAARTIALRATRPKKRTIASKEPSLPLGEMRIVDRLAGLLLGDFWKDPEDKAGRMRGQLARLGEKVRAEVIEVIASRLADADKRRFAVVVEQGRPAGTEVTSPQAAPGADDTQREQRQERTPEESAAGRSHDSTSEADAEHSDKTEDAAEQDSKDESEESKDDTGDQDTANGDGAADSATDEGAEEEPSGGLVGSLGDAVKKAFGLKRKRKPKKAKGKRGAKEREGKDRGAKDGKSGPEKPALREGEEGGEGKGEEGATPEGAEVESKGGAGGAERPAGGAEADAEVDPAPFDRLLTERPRRAGKRRGGPRAAIGDAVSAGARGQTMDMGPAPSMAESAPSGAEGAEASTESGGDATAAGDAESLGAGAGGESGGTEAKGDEATATAGGGPAAATPESETGGAGGNAPSPDAQDGKDEGSGEATTEAAPEAGGGGRGEAGDGGGAEPQTEGGGSSEGQSDAGGGAEAEGGGGAEAVAGGATTSEEPSTPPEVKEPSATTPNAASSEGSTLASASAAAPSRAPEVAKAASSTPTQPERAAGAAEAPTPAEPAAEPAGEEGAGGAAPEREATGAPTDAATADATLDRGGAEAGVEGEGATEPEGGATPGDGPEGAAAGDGASAEGGAVEGGDAGGGDSEGTVDIGGGGDGGGADAAGGGGGGGGGSPIPDDPPPEAPDVSQASPPEAMAAMAALPPAMLQSSLGGVSAAAGRSVDQKRSDLAQSPPEVKRPSGAPADHPPTADTAALASKLSTGPAGKVDALPAGAQAPPVAAPATPPLKDPPPLPSPAIAGDGPVEGQNLAAMQAATDNLPTTDPGLDVTAGDAPKLVLGGDADPARTGEQRQNLDKAAKDAQEQGTKDASKPMGEDAVYPRTPAETLKATIPQGGAGGGGGAASAGASAAPAGGGAAASGGAAGAKAGGAADDETASIVAKEQHGDEIAAQVQTQSAAMSSAQDKQDEDAKAAKEKSQADVDAAIDASAKEQDDARAKVKKNVADQRGEWSDGQQKAVKTAQGDADKVGTDTDKQVAEQRTTGESKARTEIASSNRDIATERTKAEGTARQQRAKAKKESDQGFFGRIGSAVSSFFNSIKDAIKGAFDAARKAIKAVIQKAKELAIAAIDAARDAIVKAVKAAGDALMKLGDVMLAAFPELRDKYRKAIKTLVDAAVTAVDALADQLKKDIVAALDLLGKGLDLLLGALLDAFNAAVDAVAGFVKGVINAAKGLVQALGAFAALIKDIAAHPGQWLSNLGAAVVDGIKNHLIKAFKTAIKKWFDSTVEEVIGVGKAILAVLRKGGIPWAKIAKMAWEALKAAVPAMLIQLLIEKLVAMVVPAAGALMTIIEGLKAAWGTIQQIIAAFETFVKFLKAVKGGNAGPLFAETLASAAIVVIQFVAQWLLGKLKGAGGKVGGKLREIAKKILAGLKKVGKVVVGAAKRVGKAVVKAVKTAVKYVKKGAKWVGGKLKGVVKKIANSPLAKKILNSPIVKKALGAVKKGIAKVKGWIDKGKKKWKDWREKRKAKKRQRKEKQKNRLAEIAPEIGSDLQNYLSTGASRLRLWGHLRLLQARYRLTWLTWKKDGSFEARINPKRPIPGVRGKKIAPDELGRILTPIFNEAEGQYTQNLLDDDETSEAVELGAKRFSRGTKGSLKGMSDYDRRLALMSAKPKSGKRAATDVVSMWVPPAGGKGFVEHIRPSRYGGNEKTGEKGMIETLMDRAKKLGVTDDELRGTLGASGPTREARLDALRTRLSVGVDSKSKLAGRRFVNTVDRIGFLTQALETARGPGMATAIATSSTLLAADKATPLEVFGADGPLAPQTPVGVAPESGVAKTAEQKAAAKERSARVGQIFLRLLASARRAGVVVNQGGYDLSRLAEAIRAFLAEHLKTRPSTKTLNRLEATLRAEIVAMLETYHSK